MSIAATKQLTFLIQEAHQRSGLSYREAGEECNIDYSYVSRIVAGKRTPKRDVLISLCAFAWRLNRCETDEILLAAEYKPLSPSANETIH